MYDASTAGTTQPTYPMSLIVGWSLSVTFIIIVIMTGTMLFPDIPALRPIGAAFMVVAFLAYALHLRVKWPETVLGVIIAAGLGWFVVEVSAVMRSDHEINRHQYAWVARTLRERPELGPLIAAARADRVITNDELDRFEEAIDTFDRSKALGY